MTPLDPYLSSLLGRWHQWRHHWSHERGLSRVRFDRAEDDDDTLERLTMEAIERAFDRLTPLHRLALQHAARAHCLGVDVITSPRLRGRAGETTTEQALEVFQRELRREGVL